MRTTTTSQRPNTIRPASKRRGATSVEFALIAPVLFGVVFAALEFNRLYTIRSTCDIAAMEGARRGIIPGATARQMDAAAGAELELIGLDRYRTDSSFENRADGEYAVIKVSVPVEQNSLFAPLYFSDVISRRVELKREYREN